MFKKRKNKNKVNLQTRYTTKIKLGSLVIVAILLFFYSTKLWHQSTAEVNALKIGERVTFGNQEIALYQSNYYQADDVFEISFSIIHSAEEVPSDIKVMAYNAGTNKTLTSKLEKISSDFYVLFIPNQQNYTNLKVKVSEATQGENLQLVTSQLFYLSKAKAEQKAQFKAKKSSVYFNDYVNSLIGNEKVLLEDLDLEISNFEKSIQLTEQKSKDLLENISLKTNEEQQKIQIKIESNNASIEGVRQQIEQIESEKEKIQNKINKLQSQLSTN